MSLTEREQQILDILQNDPLMAQKTIADQLGITRSSVAVHITNLTHKGFIRGKGYIFNNINKRHIVIIGGANIDITGIAFGAIKLDESNLGQLKLGAGGVGRNIADNFARLTKDDNIISYFLSAIGDDIHGQLVVEQSKQAGIDLSHCQIVKDGQTASYLSIVNGDGEMQTAINDMAIIDKINVNYLQSIKRLINEAELIIFDTNLTQDAIDYICQNFSHIPIYVDTVSGVKASKIEHNLNYLNCIMPNLNEAEILSGIHAKNDGDLSKIATYFHEKGLQNIYITRGKQGAYFSGMSNGEIHTEHLPALSGDIINANGAGDAFMAGLAAAQLSKMSLTNTLIFARACAFIAAKSEHTINPEMSQALVAEYMENNNE